MDHVSDFLFYNIKTTLSQLTEGLQQWGGCKLPQTAARGLRRICIACQKFIQEYEACEARDRFGFVSDGRNHKCRDLIVDLDDGALSTMLALDRALSGGFTWGDTIIWSKPMAAPYSELMSFTWVLDSEKYSYIPPE